MSQPQDSEAPVQRGRWRMGLLAVPLAIAVALGATWLGRERLADSVIRDYFETHGIPARYVVRQIGPTRQVIDRLVLGDPARPDFTAERVEITVRPRLGLPDVTQVRLVRPRLFGTLRRGRLSLGALDPLVFTGSKDPFALPRLDLVVQDGRARIDGDHGAIGLALHGRGQLNDGFRGELAAVAPRLALSGCDAERASLYGTVRVAGGAPQFTGPLRLARLDCAEPGVALGRADVPLDLQADADLSRLTGTADLYVANIRQGTARLAGLGGTMRFTLREGVTVLGLKLAGRGLAAGGARLGTVRLDGTLRAGAGLARVVASGTVDGTDLQPGADVQQGLASFARVAGGTLLAPLADRLRQGLAQGLPGSTAHATFDARLAGGRLALMVPDGQLRSRTGTVLLAVSGVQMATAPNRVPRISGNFRTGGPGLPQIAGRVEQRTARSARLSLQMEPWAAGTARLAIPALALVQSGDGAIGFSGQVLASGAVPGGRVDGLSVPLSGSLDGNGRMTLWRGCVPLSFARLQLAGLDLDRQRISLCPPAGTGIVSQAGGGLTLAATTPALQLHGRLNGAPLALRSGPLRLAWPGESTLRDLALDLRAADGPGWFAAERLSLRAAAGASAPLSGSITGARIALAAIPVDIGQARASWTWGAGRLETTDAAFRVADRQVPARFLPLVARGAGLTLIDGRVQADAAVREPGTDRVVARVAIGHDLTQGRGRADITVPGLTFDKGFQPTALTDMARGLVANVAGTVTGQGRIDWSPAGVTSTGRFGSQSIDLAAAFGPVKGASGTIEFSDLLGLTTAPDQVVRIASVNPGIEANDGVVRFQVVEGSLLKLNGGTWPFLGGTLALQPTQMRFGNAETRRYVLDFKGVDAARFVERMDMSNLAVTGTFDGTVPLVFDENGNGRLVGGTLLSRAPGGNISYIGQLTYEDMGAIPNFTFNALKSLDYRQMSLQMDGSLTGEIVTRVRFDGVSQGAGARRNFLTRQVSRLPFRFDVNVRAPFYSLISSIRAFYDPAFVRDPREVGLLDAAGRPIVRPAVQVPPAAPSTSSIQPSESETRR